MAVIMRSGARLSRRRFLSSAGAAAAATVVGSVTSPAISRAADRPRITHGIQSGDVSANSGVVWARADRPARMLVEAATTESFKDVCSAAVLDVLADSDFTGKVVLKNLPAGQHIFYRVSFRNLSSPTIVGAAQVGSFRTAPAERCAVSFVWSGDTAGGGWGIDPSRGGMRTYATMLNHRPDFFIHSGDTIYADYPIASEQKLPDGQIWRNIVTEEKSKVAETLDEFRGNYKYNLLDANLRAFNAEVPTFAQWDDHEVTNDWSPLEALPQGEYADRSVRKLAARGARAFHEFMPMREAPAEAGRVYRRISYGPLLDIFMLDMRSYRGRNVGDLTSYGPDAHLLGPTQLDWLKRELLRSQATWKVIAADLPIGIISNDAIAQGNGPARGRELEIADLLSFIKRAGIVNILWITADMHYTAAHYYDPSRAVFQDFDPFWEFVSGPIHAGTWVPGALDNTFGPRAVYQHGCSPAQGENLAPCFGLQFFGHVTIEEGTEVMTVTLRDVGDRPLWSVRLEPKCCAPVPGRSKTFAGRIRMPRS